MIQDKIFFDEKDPTGLSYNTPFTVYGSYQGRLWSKTPTGSIKYYTQNSDLSVYATTGSNQFSGSQTVTGSLTVTGGITGSVTTASYIEYAGVANKPALVSGSAQVTYSGLTGVPTGIVSSSAQVGGYGVFATTGSNQFNGSQAITGSLTVTGQVVAQTLNVQQVTSSIVYSSGSNIFGNSLSNTQQFTGSLQVSGSSHNILGNVGIGPTGTPVSELQVGKSSDVTIAMSNSSSVTSGNRGSLAWYNSSNSTVANIKATAVTDNVGTQLEFYTRPAAGSLTQVLTLSSTGTLGLGVTPSAWSVIQAMQVLNTSWGASPNNLISYLSSNVFYDGAFKYITTGTATQYRMNDSGVFSWLQASSGTAGNAISFTQAMTLTSGGNLYVGNTDFTSPNGADKFIGVYGGQDASLILQDAVQLWELYVNDDFYITSGATPRLTINRTTGAATFSSTNLTLQSSTEAEVRSLTTSTGNYANFIVDIDNSVNYRLQMIGFGTTASGTLAGINRAGNGFLVKSGGLLAIGTRDSNVLVLSTNETERMRITADTAAFLRMASGTGGIQFNGDTAAANALDDYEEGTFTPTIVGASSAGTGTYDRQTGVYTKIGNLVTINVWIQWNAHTGTGDMRLSNLPFTSIGTNNFRASGTFGWVENLTLSANHVVGMAMIPAATYANVTQYPAGGGAASGVLMDTAANLHLAMTYQTS